MIFKKLFLSIFLFCISFNFSFAEIIKEPYKNDISLFVSSFLTDKDIYDLGQEIKGKFILVNMKDQSVSNIKYSISLKGGFNKQMGYFEKTYDVLSYSNIFIDSLEEKTISFEYNIPNIYVEEDCAVEVRVLSDAGLPLSTYIKKIKINGNDSLFKIVDSYIDIDGKKFFLQAGPSIRENREGSIKLKISDIKEDITIFPKVKVFDRSVTGKLLKEEKEEGIILKSNIVNDIKINFTDIIKTPGVYEAELVLLDKTNKQLSEKIFFRYIVYGDIVTIQNVNTESKEFNKGDTLNLNIYYTGSPYDLTTGETPEQSIKKTDITLKNYFGIEVASISEKIDYSGEGKIIVPIVLKRTADFLSANIKIYNDNGQVLIDYETFLSNRENINLYPNIIVIILLFVFVFILSILFIYKKKKSLVVILIMFLFFSFNNVFALNPSDFIYFSNEVIPELQDLNFYYLGGSPITTYGTYTKDGITLNTVKVPPGANFTASMIAVLNGCSNSKLAEVNFDDVGGKDVNKYTYRNDPAATGTWPVGSGNGYLVIGDDNHIGTVGDSMNYLTAPMATGTYKIPLLVNTWEYISEAPDYTSSGEGYMYVQVYEDGECGDANGKVYKDTDTSYLPYKQCSSGSTSNNSFPNPGATSTWICLGNNGGVNSSECYATRSANLYPEIIYFDVESPVARYSDVTLSWESINTNNCSLLSVLNGSNLGVSTTTYSRYVTAAPGDYSYTLKCFNDIASTTRKTYFKVVDTLPSPTLTLTGDSSVLSGTSPTLSWSATNVKTCTKSGGWNGDVYINTTSNSTSEIETQEPIYINTTYDMSCVGLDNSLISRSITVAVTTCIEQRACDSSWSDCINNLQSRSCDITYTPSGCGTNTTEEEYQSCNSDVEILPLTITCRAYQNFGSGLEASTGTIYSNRDMEWRLFIEDPNSGNTSYSIVSPQGSPQNRDNYYYLSKLYQNSGVKVFNASVQGNPIGGVGVCATSVNAVIGTQIIMEE